MQRIKIDFDNPGLPKRLDVMENDAQSRFFEAELYRGGKAYSAPSGATYSIMYHGFGPQNEGWYDTINDGAGKRAACTVSGNVVTCELARQALRVPGHMTVILCVTDSTGYMLKGWPITANVRNDDYNDGEEVEMYFNLSGNVSDSIDQLKKAMAEAEQLKKDIETKAAEALASIPEDYTELDSNVKQLKEDLVNSVDGILSGTRINTVKLDDSEVWEQGVIWTTGSHAGKNRDVTFGIRTKDFISVNKSGFYEFTIKKMWKVMAVGYNQDYVFERAFKIGGTVYGDYTTQIEFSQEKKYKFYITKSADSGSTDTSYNVAVDDYVNVTDGNLAENFEINYIPKVVKEYVDKTTTDEKKSILLKHTIADWEYGSINGSNGANRDSTEYIRTGYIVFDITSETLVEVSPNYRAVIFKYSDSGVFEEIVVAKSGSTLDYGYALSHIQLFLIKIHTDYREKI